MTAFVALVYKYSAALASRDWWCTRGFCWPLLLEKICARYGVGTVPIGVEGMYFSPKKAQVNILVPP